MVLRTAFSFLLDRVLTKTNNFELSPQYTNSQVEVFKVGLNYYSWDMISEKDISGGASLLMDIVVRISYYMWSIHWHCPLFHSKHAHSSGSLAMR